MHVKMTQEGSKAVLMLSGRFDFNSHRDFRSAYESAMGPDEAREIALDLGGVEYLDSSALGMLLVLRDKVAAANKSIVLTNVQGAVKQVLDIANFGKLFQIV